jgi:pyrroline-5-carboxylate reductase
MGIAILSGVVDSLDSGSRLPREFQAAKWESHTPGTLTPIDTSDATLPAGFIACVSRDESAKKLRAIFDGLGSLGSSIEVVVGQNVESAKQADVVLLWYAQCHSSDLRFF